MQVAKLRKRWDCGARKDCVRDCVAALRRPPPCPATGKGVCGRDGKLYANDCLAQVRRHLAQRGLSAGSARAQHRRSSRTAQKRGGAARCRDVHVALPSAVYTLVS